jgi:hypothetical protein
VLSAVALCMTAMAASPLGGASQAQEPFIDDFSGPAGSLPDPAKWVDYGPGCGAFASWGRIRCGMTEHLDGRGHLVIPATPAAGSALQTAGLHGFTYGTIAAWIKMPSEPGYWPAFWALNGDQAGGESRTGEIDVTEVYTSRRGSHANAHVWDGGRQQWETRDVEAMTHTDLSKRFHKYSVDLSPGRIEFFVDDVSVRIVKKSSSPRWAWGPDVMRQNFLIFDLAVRRAPSRPASMLVDRVLVVPSGTG